MHDIPDAKIAVPELAPEHVARPRLLTELSATSDIALICAPAGYGKTLLLAEWARAQRDTGTAWVSLDAYDNDPGRLWSGVARALARCPAVPASSQLRSFRRWPAGDQPEFLSHLLAAVSALPRPVALILDDVHEVEATEARQGLQTFLRNRPRTLTVFLASRYDPALGLHRLRLAERVMQLRLEQLRFTAAEAQALLEATGLRLRPAEVEVLLQRTGGWAAGLRLAAVALARVPNVEEFLEDFSGDDHSVADYLYAEVLSKLSEDTLELLRATSVSDPVPVELAAELSGREDAGDVFAVLERRTDMVKAVDRGRRAYRVQPLVRGYLVADLSRHGRRRVAQMHAGAARWWACENHPRNALDHAARSGDHELLTGMLRRFSLPLLLSGDHDALRGSLVARGSEALREDPWTALVSALLHHENGELTAAERDARMAVRCWPSEPDEDLGLLRMAAGLGLLDDHEWRPGPIPIGREPASTALAGMIRCLTQLRERRDVPAARELLSDALALAREYGFDYLALQCLALSGVAAATDADPRAMRAAGTEAVELADRHGWRHSPAGLIGSALGAYGALLAAEPDNAEKLVTAVLDFADISAPRIRFALHWIRAAAAADRGQLADSLAEMHHARAVLGDRTVSPVEAVAPAVLEFEAAARPGHLAAARSVHSWMHDRVGETAEGTLMKAREHEAMGRYPSARTLVNAVLDGDVEAVLPHTMVDAWLRAAGLAAAADDRLAARRALDNALLIAEPLDALRPFAEAGPTVRELLAQWHSGTEVVVHEFARRALAAGRARNRLATMLSERELTVLSLLPSLLSLEDIAHDLSISVNTVKSHVRAVYRKLGVSSRRAAVLAAHEHGLIGSRRSA